MFDPIFLHCTQSVHSQKNASSFKQSLTNGDGKEHCNIKNDFEQNGWYRNCKHDKEQVCFQDLLNNQDISALIYSFTGYRLFLSGAPFVK